jgi:hypothetical protein
MGNCICGGGALADDRDTSWDTAGREVRRDVITHAAPRYRDERWSQFSSSPDSPAMRGTRPVFSLTGVAPRRPPTSPRWHTVHWVDYQSGAAASATASMPGEVCRTTGMDLCLAVAVGGEKEPESPGDLPAHARLFHVLPENARAGRDVARYIDELQRSGYHVRAAVRGADTGSASSKARLAAIRDVLAHYEVPIELEIADRETGEALGTLGVGIDADGRLEFLAT